LFIIIMQYVSGGDLGKLISERGFLGEELVQAMGAQLLSALGYLHENNITHRDVKPDNILIDSLDPFEVKLTDFGLSKMVDNEQTFLRTFCGTLLYCAPEVYSEFVEYDQFGRRHPRNRTRRAPPGQRYDHAVDVWSLGGVLFYALTSRPPYPVRSGVSYSELLHQIMTTPLNTAPLRQVGISMDGINFLGMMLDRRPETRATVVALEEHPWIGGPGVTIRMEDSQSFDEISDDEGLRVEASQLSIAGHAQTTPFQLVDDEDLIDRIEETDDEESDKENYTFGPGTQQPPRLFGEVNVSAIGSSGVIPANRLNLPVSRTNYQDSVSGETEIKDSFESEESFTPRRKSQPGGAALLSQSIIQSMGGSLSGAQSADQLQSLVLNVASQSLGESDSVSGNLSMRSLSGSDAVSHVGEPGRSKRRVSPDTSDDFEETRTTQKPTFKRLKSESNLDGLTEEVLLESRLLECVPAIERLKSGRQIDGPADKVNFWDNKDLKTWHLQYPEMSQLQYDAFVRASRDLGEDFGPSTSRLWEVALKWFPPTGESASNSKTPESIALGEDAGGAMLRTPLQREDRAVAGRDVIDVPSTMPPPSLGSQTETQIVVPVAAIPRDSRALAIIESEQGYKGEKISIVITDAMASFGRAQENTVLHWDRMDIAVPKNAFKILLWKDGFDPAKDPAKVAPPWNEVSDGKTDLDYFFYLSTKASNGVAINKFRLEPHDQHWARLYDGDVIVLSSGAKVIFKCFWGGSSQPRPDEAIAPVATTIAKKLNEAFHKTEKRVKSAAGRQALLSEAQRDLQRREQFIEQERERSRIFELRRAEAVRLLTRLSPSKMSPSRRGSPHSNGEHHHHSRIGGAAGVSAGTSSSVSGPRLTPPRVLVTQPRTTGLGHSPEKQ
jgi:serine/threonine protein kinase